MKYTVQERLTIMNEVLKVVEGDKAAIKMARYGNPNAVTKQIIKNLKCKMIGFFITNIIIMGMFWYYISAFCAVYQKTQVPWLEGCFISFIFCVLFQMIYALFITAIRYIGLKCKISCFYTLSTYLI